MFPPTGAYPPPPNLFSMATITLMVTLTFFMHGSLIVMNAWLVKAYRGVRTAALATFSLALGFLTNVLAAPISMWTGLLSHTFIVAGFVFFYVALCRFTESKCSRWLLLGILPVGYIGLVLAFYLNMPKLPEIYFALFLEAAFALGAGCSLVVNGAKHYVPASYLTAAPLFIYALVTIIRLGIGIVAVKEILPSPSTTNAVGILTLFVCSYLWTAGGFTLMVSQRMKNDLNDLAMNDALTRVHNRRAMQGMLDFEMERFDEELREFSIILLDVDHFKRVNDNYGHDVGDIVLKWLASTLQSKLRVQDVIARWGGEEFLILLPDTTLEAGMEIGERLRSEIANARVETDAGALNITFSAGIANSQKTREVDELCKIADQALYHAKKTRNRIASEKDMGAFHLS